jgi:phospholipid-translocating ATPase
MLCVTQFFPRLQVGFLITYIGPLAFVIGLTALKEFFDDRARMKRDQMYNDELFRVYGRGRPGGGELRGFLRM